MNSMRFDGKLSECVFELIASNIEFSMEIDSLNKADFSRGREKKLTNNFFSWEFRFEFILGTLDKLAFKVLFSDEKKLLNFDFLLIYSHITWRFWSDMSRANKFK